MIFGVMCAIIGAGIWLLNLVGGGFNWGRDWPFLLLIFGLYKIWDYSRNRGRSVHSGNKKEVKEILKKVERGDMDAREAVDKLED